MSAFLQETYKSRNVLVPIFGEVVEVGGEWKGVVGLDVVP